MNLYVVYEELTNADCIEEDTRRKNILSYESVVVPEVPDFIKINKVNEEKYRNLMYILNLFSNVRSNSFPTRLCVSTHGFLTRWFNKMSVSRYLQELVNLGVISVDDETFTFNDEVSGNNHSKTYIWFPNNEREVYKMLTEKGLTPASFNKNKSQFFVDTDEVGWSVRLRLKVQCDCQEFVDAIIDALHRKYKKFAYFEELVSKINKAYYTGRLERIISYKPSFLYSADIKRVTHCTIRYTNDFCSYSKERKEGIPYRNDYLFSNGLNLKYDIKGSAPKINMLMRSGVWYSNEVDPYEMIYKEFIKLSPDEKYDWNDKMRECVKFMFMRTFYEPSVDSTTNHIRHSLKLNSSKDKNKIEEIRRTMTRFREAMINVIGESLDVEVFYHESNLYLLVLEELLKKGYDVVTCYDCFYAKKNGVSQKQFEEEVSKLLDEKAREYIV